MKKIGLLLFFSVAFMLSSCNSSKTASNTKSDLNKELNEKNKGNISLLERIRRKPGITLRGGVPILNKTANSFNQGNPEPLYVLNSYVVGSSFRSVDQLVDNFNVKEIKVLSGPDASEYGSRGANGVIVIITYN
ncbi:MAG: Plug domain-containing protein [Maribacter sp.]|nr:Plug domain-containing protein [Maribacter sp.]NNK18853.1 Plug domain-containing protein [Maribacter sp.]